MEEACDDGAGFSLLGFRVSACRVWGFRVWGFMPPSLDSHHIVHATYAMTVPLGQNGCEVYTDVLSLLMFLLLMMTAMMAIGYGPHLVAAESAEEEG